MRVEAVRSDGALLVTHGGRAAAIISDEGSWLTTRESALARGEWDEPGVDSVIPAHMRENLITALTELDQTVGKPFEMPDPETGSNTSLIAAAEVHTGAMVALIPSAADAERLAVDGGEPAEQLHVTLCYLGEAALIPPEVRDCLVECVSHWARQSATIIGKAFGVSMFNPPDLTLTAGGGEPCVVLGLSGSQLEEAYEQISPIVTVDLAKYGVEKPPPYHPWTPHITLLYTDDADLSYFTDRMGPITFDTVRLVFGGDIYDIPLGEHHGVNDGMLTSPNGDVEGNSVTSAEIRELTASGTHAFKFNPNQARDSHGRWTDGPGVGEGGFGTLPDQDFSDLKQVGGRAGSNPGGFFESPNGQRFYVKKARSPEHAANEIAASRLYNLAGIPTPLVQSGHGAPGLGGEVQTATQLIPGARADFADKVDVESYRSEVQRGFIIDAWLANWDVAGLEFDNVVTDRHGQPWRVDTGGALTFRAQGAPKGKFFGDQVTELDTLRDPGMNRQSEHVFGDITDVEIDAGIAKLRRITPAQIDEVISSSGVSQSVADRLKRRREYILDRYDTGDLTAGAFERERDVNAPGGGHNLKNYWVRGEGAAKIGWGTDGSFARCVALLSEHVKNPQGLCAEYHKAATGEWPAEKGVESVAETEAMLFRRNQRRDTHGRWADEGGDISNVADALNAGDVREINKAVDELTYNDFIRLSVAERIELQRKAPDMSKSNRDKVHEFIRYAEDAGDLDDDGRDAGYTAETITAADDPKKPYGDVQYADPGYQEDGKKRYPIDTEEHIRAAWSYINQEANAAKYTDQQLAKVKARIQRAMKSIGAEVTASADCGCDDVALTAGVGGGKCPPGTHKMKDGSCMDDSEMPDKTEAYALDEDAPAPAVTAPWKGVLTVEGVESGDGRMFAPSGLTWDEPPLPLMWQRVTSHGGTGDESVRVGSIQRIWREPDPQGRADVFAIWGEGTLDLNNRDGVEVYRRMLEGDMRGNSVDVDSVKGSDVEFRYADMITAEDDGGADGAAPVVNLFAQPELTVYKKGRIRASTMVEIPAFTEARLELTDEPLTADAAAERTLELEHDPDEIARQMENALVAAAATINITDAPPREWFEEPTDVTATGALTVTHEGRVYGYVAPAGVRHRSFGARSVYVPLKNVDYSRFMGGETIVADGGRVATGAITMGCGHATTELPLTSADAKDHYDNTCALVATVRVGENQHGVWFAGALLPDVTPHQVRRMMACRLSGDWRPHMDRPGWRELTAALLVPVPGFPMVRSAPSVQVEEGQLVAAFVPVEFEPGPTPRERAAAVVRAARVRQLRSRVAQRTGVLQ